MEPRLVVFSGLAGVGKTSTIDELLNLVPNAFLLEKDAINQASLHIRPTNQGKLPTLEQYVIDDSVFPNHAREVSTPFGPMIQVDPKNEFYGRHARDQAYIIMASIAGKNLRQGKVPIIDCMVIRQIQDGTLRRFLDQEAFVEFQKYLVHVTAEENDLYERLRTRAQRDSHAAVRDQDNISSREQFHKFVTETQPIVPKELQSYEHLLLNTSGKAPKECAKAVYTYITS